MASSRKRPGGIACASCSDTCSVDLVANKIIPKYDRLKRLDTTRL